MEKGTLLIQPTKKGYAARIRFTKRSGQQSELIVTSFKPTQEHFEKYHDQPCDFLRDNGSLTTLIAHDGSYLVGKIVVADAKKTHGNSDSAYVEQKKRYPDAFDPHQTKLPQDTRNALKNIASPDNFALKFSQAARFDEKHFSFYKKDKRSDKSYLIQANYGDTSFEALVKRSEQQAKVLFKANNVVVKTYKIDWRYIQGLGGASVYEVGMTLHPVYGFPYVPASVIKGIVRSWIITNAFSKNGLPSEKNALLDPTFCDIFGCPTESYYKEARKGNVTFFDALPLNAPEIEVDIMSPHYGGYYGDSTGKVPPADYLRVIPVPFLVITNTSFRFLMASHELSYIKEKKIQGQTLSGWFDDALRNHGIGAKTALGYGLMNPDPHAS